MRNHLTFRDILLQTAEANSRRVLQRAVMASSVAKVASGLASRRAAYAVKHVALEHGVAMFAAEFSLSGVEEDGKLIRVNWRGRVCLHMPAPANGSCMDSWADRERARILQEWTLQAA